MMKTTIQEPAREIPVLGEYDVVVCGGGPAGCAAAIAAARHGAKPLLVEKDGYLGGATVSQLVSVILSTNGVDFQGVWHDYARGLRQLGGLRELEGFGSGQIRGAVDPEMVKFVWDDLLSAAGVDNLLIAGRCLSAEHTAQSSLRIQQTCMATGQAAGTAAALSLRAGVVPAVLDPAALVAQLARDRDVEPAFERSLLTLMK